jgi:DNA-binding SARP family transcriptional activator/pimeloyl-ACP methyl ester carboxylesterase
MASTQLLVLGPPRLERDAKPLVLPLRRAVALLVYLAVTERPQSRETLAMLLWPESDHREARGRLRRTLHRLIELLGDDVLDVEGDTLRLAADADLWVDCSAFQDHAAAGLTPRDARAALLEDQIRHLTQAAALYVDDFMAGFAVPDSSAWDEWQFLQREHLRQRFAQVLELLVDAQGTQGAWEAAAATARRWVGLDPLHEPAQRALMRAYALAGQQAAALRQYQECVRVLDTELGVEPEADTTALYDAIRSRRLTPPPPAAAAGPPPWVPAGLPSTPLPETKYARSGDVSIAYQVAGDGPLDLVFVMGWVSHLDYFWEEPGFAHFLRQLASFSRLILFDKRGTGLSDRAVGLPTLEERMDDVRAVMDAVGSKRAAIVGASEGGSMSILFAATYPERTAALVLLGCFPRRLWAPDFPWVVTREERAEYWRRLEEGWGSLAWAQEDVKRRAPSASSDERFQRWWSTYLRMSASPGAAMAMSRMNAEIDVRHVLSAIRVPTLIIHRSEISSRPSREPATWRSAFRMPRTSSYPGTTTSPSWATRK